MNSINFMKRNFLVVLVVCLINTGLFSQKIVKKEYQDPAYWINLKSKEDGIPVKLISKSKDIEYLKAPVKLKAKNQGKLVRLEISIDSIKLEVQENDSEIVYVHGKINLNCCRKRPVNIELLDKDKNYIQFTSSDDDGNFKLKSINGNILEIKNKKIKFNFKTIKTIDVVLDERFATLERNKVLSAKKIKRLRKKEKNRTQN